MAARAGQLSPLLRCAWDGGNLSAHDGHRYIQATEAHISIVGHVTQSELAHHLGHTESHNGFANRCLWTSVRRSKSLPNGGSLPTEQQSAIAAELRRALNWLQSQKELVFSRTPAASELWNDRYDALSQGRGDAYGAATSRAEAQVLRLSAIYAALDRTPLIDACHVEAALAVWDYCLASARLLFDTAPIDPTARRISEALDLAPEGLSRAQIRSSFSSPRKQRTNRPRSRTTAETRPCRQGNRHRPRPIRKSLDQNTKPGNRYEHSRNRPLWRLRRTLPHIRRIGRLRRTLPHIRTHGRNVSIVTSMIAAYTHGFAMMENPPMVDTEGYLNLPQGPGLGVESTKS